MHFRWRHTAADRVRAELFARLFHEINHRFFGGDAQTRFTVFAPPTVQTNTSPNAADTILPWYRYQLGVQSPTAAAESSGARYGRGEGITGRAWQKPGELFVAVFPPFGERPEFEQFYIERMGIPPSVVSNLSDHMMSARTVFAYAFQDERGRDTGVLSVDDARPFVPDREPGERSDGTLHLDAATISLVLYLAANLLLAFRLAED